MFIECPTQQPIASSDINLDEYLSGNSMATVFYDVNGEKVTLTLVRMSK